MKMTRILTSLLFLLAASTAYAAKISVSWVNPTEYEQTCTTATPPVCKSDPLNDLKSILIEWGTCNGSNFGTRQASLLVMQTPVKVTKATIYPTALAKVCIRAFALNSKDVQSASSGIASKVLLPTTGKPVKLDQPIIIPNDTEK